MAFYLHNANIMFNISHRLDTLYSAVERQQRAARNPTEQQLTTRALGALVLRKCLERSAETLQQVERLIRADTEEEVLLLMQEQLAKEHADLLLDTLERLASSVEEVAFVSEWLQRLERRLRELFLTRNKGDWCLRRLTQLLACQQCAPHHRDALPACVEPYETAVRTCFETKLPQIGR